MSSQNSVSVHEISTNELLDKFDKAIKGCLEDEWIGSINMEIDKNACGLLTTVDICDFLSIPRDDVTDTLYFDRERYPPPDPGTVKISSSDPTFEKLKKTICLWASESGSPVMANGSCQRTGARYFRCCYCSRSYRPRTYAKGPYRSDYLVNSDKKGRRIDGKSLSRRSNTKCTTEKGKFCKFSFTIHWDEKGFFLKQTAGNKNHRYHPKVDPSQVATPGYLIDEETKETILQMSQSCISSSTAATFAQNKVGRFVTKASIAYMQDSNFKDPSYPDITDVESLLKMFQDSNEISYQILWDMPVASSTKLLSEVCDRETNMEHGFDHSLDPAYSDIALECSNRRLEKNLPVSHKIFVAVAFANVELLRLFRMYPYVIYCDTTSDTNKKAKHLFTMSGRTPSGNTFVFLTAWIHNQRQSTFQWMFESVLRSFIPKSILEKVQLILVDGDPQQRGALQTTIERYFPNNVTQIGTCAWHLFSQGYKRKGPKIGQIPDSKKSLYRIFQKTLLTWLYSFTRPGYVEDMEEYKISKKCLLAWIQHKTGKGSLL